MAEVKWIKITTDMFDNRKIKYLRKFPDGNNIVLIWVMLLTMAGRCNSGGLIFLTENIPYTPKMLADELDFEENTVLLALKALEEMNMIVTDNNGFFSVAGWEKHQNVEGMEKIREQNRIRKQVQRARQKEQLLLNENNMSRDSHGTVTGSHAIDKDKERDKEEDNKNKSKKKNNKKEDSLELLTSLLPSFIVSDSVKSKMTEWVLYKAERKDFYTETGLKSLLRQVEKNCKTYGEQSVVELIDECMSNLYKGIIFDKLKTSRKDSPKQQNPSEAPEFLKKWSV